jgi:hypothetical protein
MEHNKGSIEEVVGRVLRNTKVQDTSYFADILRWITEAAAAMQTKWVLQGTYADADVHFYKAEMPCGLVRLQAVEYNGYRLPQRNLSRHASLTTPETVSGVWVSEVKTAVTPNGNLTYLPSGQVITLPQDPTEWYTEDGPGYIQLSFKEGIVRFHYKKVPHDKNGWSLIPDLEDYKEAMYWYCRTKMIESGWGDTVLNWQTCDAKWREFSERATAAIKYPSTNRMEELCDHVTLIPPQNYFETFNNLYT